MLINILLFYYLGEILFLKVLLVLFSPLIPLLLLLLLPPLLPQLLLSSITTFIFELYFRSIRKRPISLELKKKKYLEAICHQITQSLYNVFVFIFLYLHSVTFMYYRYIYYSISLLFVPRKILITIL